MNPIVSLLLKQLPSLLPVVESLVRRTPPPRPEDNRLDLLEQSFDRLIERSQQLEGRLRRMTLFSLLAAVMALIALVAAFVH